MRRTLIPVLLVFLITCAIRENFYDPLSPLHHSPTLRVSLAYDTLKVLGRIGDTIHADGPFPVSLKFSSQDFFNPEDTLPVTLTYTNGNRFSQYEAGHSDTSFNLIEIGFHNFSFKAKAENGATTEYTYTIYIEKREIPRFITFSCTPDSFPLNPPLDRRDLAFFNCTIFDPYSMLSYVIFNYGSFDSQLKSEFEYSHDTAYTNYPYSFSPPSPFPNDTLIPVTAILFDVLNRTDTTKTYVIFSKNKYTGLPPHIDSIFIIDRPNTIVEDKAICFDIAAHDLDSISDTTNFLTYEWRLGDGSITTYESSCHTYYNPGKYTIIATVTDKDQNQTSDSIQIEVKPQSEVPQFSFFNVASQSFVVPCSLYISAKATSATSSISHYEIEFNDEDPIMLEVTEFIDREYILTDPDMYIIKVTVADEEGNTRDTSFTLTVTEPD